MAKKKELTEEETIAELQKKIDAYNKKIGKPGGGRRPKPGDTIMRPQPVKPGGGIKKRQPVKPKPSDGIKYKQPINPGKPTDKKYRPEIHGPKKLKGTR
jgi:hypothetical protein